MPHTPVWELMRHSHSWLLIGCYTLTHPASQYRDDIFKPFFMRPQSWIFDLKAWSFWSLGSTSCHRPGLVLPVPGTHIQASTSWLIGLSDKTDSISHAGTFDIVEVRKRDKFRLTVAFFSGTLQHGWSRIMDRRRRCMGIFPMFNIWLITSHKAFWHTYLPTFEC